MFSRLGVFSGCEGECREVLIAGDLEGVLGGTERTGCQVVSVGIISGEISTAFGRGPTSSAVARLPRRLCWAAVGSRGGPAHVFFCLYHATPQRASTALRITLSPSFGL